MSKHVVVFQEVNEGCVDEWAEQLGEALQILRSLRDEGARVNVSCQMGRRDPNYDQTFVFLRAWFFFACVS